MNTTVIGLQPSVSTFCDSFGVTEPFRDLWNALAFTFQDAGETVSHDVRRDPFQFLRLHKVSKGASNIVAVTSIAVRHIGLQGKIQWVTVFEIILKELSEGGSEGNHTLFVIFWTPLALTWPETLSDTPLNVERSAAVPDFKPINTSLANLSSPKSGIESAKGDEPKIISRSRRKQIVLRNLIAELFTGDVFCVNNADLRDRVINSESANLGRPIKERAERHHITFGSRFAHLTQKFVVKVLALIRTDRCDRVVIGQPICKRFQDQNLGLSGVAGILALGLFVSNELVNLGFQSSAQGMQERTALKIASHQDCFGFIRSVQGNERTLTVHLLGIVKFAPLYIEIRDTGSLHEWASVNTRSRIENKKEARTVIFSGREVCAVQDLNLRPLQCQNGGLYRGVHTLAFTGGQS